ncbi:MAG: MFS transporter [Telmatospirillum sp.]|nr:MFS transporter [Telmatospirillum sp.]
MTTLVLAIALATLDTAIANTALPTIAADLRASADQAIWIINAYQLAMVATLLPLAAWGDVIGLRPVYVGGLLLFTLASLGCGLAESLPTLTAARVLQGVGAAGILSVTNALIRFIHPADRLGRAQGVNALTVAVFFAVGPTVASAVLSIADWPWLFLINIPAGLAAALLALRTIPANRQPVAHRFDLVAALLLAGMFGLLILGLGEAAHRTGVLRSAGPLLGSVACCGILLVRQRSHPAPLFPVDLFRRPVFALSVATSVCSYAAQGLAFVSLPFLFQNVLGRSLVETGLLMTPWPVLVAIAAPVAGRLSDRHPVAMLSGAGLLVLSLGMALLAAMPDQPGLADISWRLAVCGAGFGFFQSPNLKALMASAPRERSGAASGLIPTARLIGQAGGAALVAACFSWAGEPGAVLALWLGAGFAAIASVASVLRRTAPSSAR